VLNRKSSGRGIHYRVVTLINGITNVELEKILEMGFEEGFSAALCNLDEILIKDF